MRGKSIKKKEKKRKGNRERKGKFSANFFLGKRLIIQPCFGLIFSFKTALFEEILIYAQSTNLVEQVSLRDLLQKNVSKTFKFSSKVAALTSLMHI